MIEESGVEFDDLLTEVLEEADTEGIEPPEDQVTVAHSVNTELQEEVVEDRIHWFADRFEIPSTTVQMARSSNASSKRSQPGDDGHSNVHYDQLAVIHERSEWDASRQPICTDCCESVPD